MSTVTTQLFLIDDLENVSKTRELAETDLRSLPRKLLAVISMMSPMTLAAP